MKLQLILISNLVAFHALAKPSDAEKIEKMVKPNVSETFKLPNHDFRPMNLDSSRRVEMRNSNFKGANFSGTPDKPKIIRNIDFTGSDLTGADFSYTNITKCRFNEAKVDGAKFKGSNIKFSGFRDSTVNAADFSESKMESVGFNKSALLCTTWEGAKLFRVSFAYSDERGRTGKVEEKDCSHEKSQTGKVDCTKLTALIQ